MGTGFVSCGENCLIPLRMNQVVPFRVSCVVQFQIKNAVRFQIKKKFHGRIEKESQSGRTCTVGRMLKNPTPSAPQSRKSSAVLA